MSFIRPSLPSARGARVGQQRHLAAVLDRRRDVALVLRAVAGDSTGADLAAVGDELPQQVGVLVVDVRVLLLAEGAHLLLRLASRGLGHGCCAPVDELQMAAGGRGRTLEGRFVGHATRSRRGPGVVGAATGGPAAEAAAPAAPAASAALALDDLGRGVFQRRSDLIDVDLVDGALLAFLGFVRPLLQTPLHDHPSTTLQRLGDVLRGLPPDAAAEEQRVAVLPLVGLLVEEPWGRGNGEVGNGGTAGGEPQLRVVGQVADNGDGGLSCHARLLLRVRADELGAQHGLVEVELAVERLDGRGLGGDVEDRVYAFDLLVDLESETTASPDVDLLHAAAALPDDAEELVERGSDGALFEIRVENDHEFVTTHEKRSPPSDLVTRRREAGRRPRSVRGRRVLPGDRMIDALGATPG